MAPKKSTPRSTLKRVTLKKVKPPAKAAKKPALSSKPMVKATAKKTTLPKAVKKPASSKTPPKARAKSALVESPSLGRPLVTQEERLYMLFHDDYEARQVFEFLRVETVADLEQLSPDEIVKVLTAPVRRTIQRIRQRLAEKNRSLQGDEEFTRQHKAKLQ